MKALFSFLLILASLSTFAQETSSIKQQAELYAKAADGKDYETVIKFTYPPFIQMMGGRENAVLLIKSAMENLRSKGTFIESTVVGSPQKIFTAGKELHALVPIKSTSKVPEGRSVLNSYMLAVSADEGKTWTFLNLTGGAFNNNTISRLIPNFNQALIIPSILPPTFIKE